MGSWSTSAPSLPAGSSWSAEQNTGSTGNDQYYKGRAVVAIARGPGDTIYIRFKIQSYLKVQGQGARSYPMKARVSIGGVEETSGTFATGGDHYGRYETMATVYYTGTAGAGTGADCRAVQGSNVSTKTTLTAPDLITFAVDYDGNGSDGGATASQSKVYGVDLTLQTNGYARSGWAFTGWNTAADGSGTGYAAGGTYSANADVTLYAQWVQTNLPVYANVGGTVKQIAKAYANVGGVIKECRVYANVNGVIKEIV